MDIKIRNVPTQVANEIDKIAKDEGISQNTLYNKIISDYVKSSTKTSDTTIGATPQ